MKRSLAERVCAVLLWCYPPSFRRTYGAEVRQFVRTAAAREQGWAAARFVADTAVGLPREWLNVRSNFRTGEFMRTIIRDSRHAARLLARAPGFTAAAVMTLALGIGANTAIFTLADVVLLRPVHVRAPQEFVVWPWSSSYPDFQEYAKRTDIFNGVAAITGASRLNLAAGDSADLVWASFVSGSAFDVLGVSAAHGRPLLPSDDVANGAIVAVLGHDYWKTHFGADPAVVGRSFRANGKQVTIVGVLEPGFRGITLSANPALYLPTGVFNQVQTGFFSRANALTTRGFSWLTVLGRLRPDVPVSVANERMTRLYAELHPRKSGKPSEPVALTPLVDRALGGRAANVRTFVSLLIGVVATTLLIGCTNLANLLLARAAARKREIGVRMALGAGRGTIVRQMLIESILLATLGGTAGLMVAAFALNVLSAYELPGGIAIGNLGLELNRVTLVTSGVLSLATGLLFGIMPAWRASGIDVLVSLRDTTRGATTRSPIRSVLLGVQIAMCLVLLTGTGLFARTLQAALSRPLGFDPGEVVTLSVNSGLARYDEARAKALYTNALDRVRALPQVESAAWADMIPTRGSWVQQVTVEPFTGAPKVTIDVNASHVGPAYFRTLGTRLLAGREFADTDGDAAPPVAVINEAMARKYWGDRDPLGGRVGGAALATVVGVVEDVVDTAIGGEPVPFVYLAFNQSLSGPDSIATDRAHLFVRSRVRPAATIPLVRDQLRSIDPELPLFDVEPLSARVAALLMPQRMGLTLFAFFSLVGVGLATVGIYGVASYVAALRTREIGLRVALGASAGAVRRLMLAQASVPVAGGILAGVALALYLSRTVKTFLLDVSPFDPLTFASVTAALAAIAMIATYVPAWRASRVEPVTALRNE